MPSLIFTNYVGGFNVLFIFNLLVLSHITFLIFVKRIHGVHSHLFQIP